MAVIRDELADLDPRVCLHTADSVAWLRAQPEHSLDWLYIDTTHDYARTICELHLARRVVRPGGLIAGHDFSRAFPGVVQAVTEFATAAALPITLYDGDLLGSYVIQNA
jgi:spermidine synthase